MKSHVREHEEMLGNCVQQKESINEKLITTSQAGSSLSDTSVQT